MEADAVDAAPLLPVRGDLPQRRGPDLAELRLADAWADRRLAVCARAFAALPAPACLLAEEIVRASAP